MPAGAGAAVASSVAEAAGESIRGLGQGSTGGNLAERMDNKTAAIRETKAAGAPAPTVAGQPEAPAPAGGTGDAGLTGKTAELSGRSADLPKSIMTR